MKFSDKAIKKYGRKITVYDESDKLLQQTRCIIQPLRYKNKMYTQGIPTEIGLSQSGYYLMIAPSVFDVDSVGETGYISDGNMTYHLDRGEKVYFSDRVLFMPIWICSPREYMQIASVTSTLLGGSTACMPMPTSMMTAPALYIVSADII